jgi:hypothetical protein
MEKSAYTQQSESGSYLPWVKTFAAKWNNISGNANFQISSHETLRVYDLHNTYLQLDVEMELVFTIDIQFAQATTDFLYDKHVPSFFKQGRIC